MNCQKIGGSGFFLWVHALKNVFIVKILELDSLNSSIIWIIEIPQWQSFWKLHFLKFGTIQSSPDPPTKDAWFYINCKTSQDENGCLNSSKYII